MDSLAIEAVSLSKTFHSKVSFWGGKQKATLAVDSLSLTVQRGELFGLLGPNGAGKTTTVKMLSTLLLPSAGTAHVLGMDIARQTREVRKRIGFTFGGPRGLYARLSAKDNLRYFCELYRLDPAISRRRIPELLELVGLSERGNDRVETFSSGMQQRLHLARVLLHDPELIFLDEPTVGIDPVGARELRRTVKQLISAGKTILLTTHYMAEAEELCDRIAIINHGRFVGLDTPAELKKRTLGETLIAVQVRGADTPAVLECLRMVEKQAQIQVTDLSPVNQIAIRTAQPGRVLEVLAPFIQQQVIQNMEVRNPTLEDVYVAIIQAEAA